MSLFEEEELQNVRRVITDETMKKVYGDIDIVACVGCGMMWAAWEAWAYKRCRCGHRFVQGED